MKQKQKRPRRGLRLIIAGILLLLLFFLGWMTDGRPVLTAGAAFRQGLRDAMLPACSMDTIIQSNLDGIDCFGIGANDKSAFSVPLRGPKTAYFFPELIWWSVPGAREFPAVEGVRYVLLDRSNRWDDELDFASFNPVVAVKTEGCEAELRLVLDPTDPELCGDDTTPYPGGTWVLPIQDENHGWTIFTVDSAVLSSFHSPEDFEKREAENQYYNWLMAYMNGELTGSEPWNCGHFELTLRDRSGTEIKTIAITPQR